SEDADDRAVGDGQVAEGDGGGAADVEDATGVVAADGQLALAGPGNGQAVGDVQLAAGQGEGAVQAAGETDQVGAGVGVGVHHRLARRSGAAVGEVHDGEGAGQRAVLQRLQPGRTAGPWSSRPPPGGGAEGPNPAAQGRGKQHGVVLQGRAGLRYNDRTDAAGA